MYAECVPVLVAQCFTSEMSAHSVFVQPNPQKKGLFYTASVDASRTWELGDCPLPSCHEARSIQICSQYPEPNYDNFRKDVLGKNIFERFLPIGLVHSGDLSQ